jgi:hypothetical protein
VQEKQVGLKFNGTHQLLAYADDVNLLEDNIDTMKKTQKLSKPNVTKNKLKAMKSFRLNKAIKTFQANIGKCMVMLEESK